MTEFGIAYLRGRTVRERAQNPIAVSPCTSKGDPLVVETDEYLRKGFTACNASKIAALT